MINVSLLIPSLWLLLALTAAPSFASQAHPPTVDPTYGLASVPTQTTQASPSHPANWIWADKTSDNQTVYFRRKFDVKSVPASAILYITADDFFTLYVDGKQVDGSVPDENNDLVWQKVHQIDISPFLSVGENMLAVGAVNANNAAGLIARLDVPGDEAIETDEQWRVSRSSALPDDWNTTSFDDDSWSNATVIAGLMGGAWITAGGLPNWPGFETPKDYLAHITLPFMNVVNIHSGHGQISGADGLAGHIDGILTVTPAPPGALDSPSLLLDAGKEIAGRVLIDPLTPGTILVGTGESEDEATDSPWGGQSSIALSPGVRSMTSYSAFRYVRLVFPESTNPNPIRMRISIDHKYYPVVYKGSFSCSDPLLTRIWYTGAYTSHLCMQEDIWDAPKRDRARWIGDMHVSGEVINNVFADQFLMEQTLTRLRADAGGGHVNQIPGYSCAWICCLADFHRHIGDYVFLDKRHDNLLALLDYLRGDLDNRDLFENKHGAWPFVDWSPDFDGDTPMARATTDMFLVKAVNEAVFLLNEMGDPDNARKYAALANELTDAARANLVDSGSGTYGARLQENSMAIYSGVATPAQRSAIYTAVLAPHSPAWDESGKLLGNRQVLSPYYGNYTLYAMSMAHHNSEAMDFLREYWGGMLAEGATTFWEAYDPKWPKEHFHRFLQADGNTGYYTSLCHGWSSGPTSWLTERVLGVRPTGGGFKTAVLAPDLGSLSWAEGAVPTPRGSLRVREDQAAGKTVVVLTLPSGITLTVGLTGAKIIVNGRRVEPAYLASDHIYVVLAKSGTYKIVTKS